MGHGSADAGVALSNYRCQDNKHVFIGKVVGHPYSVKRELRQRPSGVGHHLRSRMPGEQLDAETHVRHRDPPFLTAQSFGPASLSWRWSHSPRTSLAVSLSAW